MKIETVIKESFAVIGKEGSTKDGHGFIQKLWKEAAAEFDEVASLGKRKDGKYCGFWGAMTDFSRSFLPWEDNFSKGFYLAGVECEDDAQAPEGWVKWIVPGYEFLVVECTSMDTFPQMIQYLNENDIPLVGAAHDFTNPKTQKNYMYFPIRKL
ncbi:MAG: GyrI-like domain-containing protein [Bacillota bacterium]|nr:GyrI-like domain-containing protein [Bacillota bacterium]